MEKYHDLSFSGEQIDEALSRVLAAGKTLTVDVDGAVTEYDGSVPRRVTVDTSSSVMSHNGNTNSHSDIREAVAAKYTRPNNGIPAADMHNTVQALLAAVDGNNYYDEITHSTERINGTTCYFVTIPVTDSGGEIISPYLAYSANLTPMQYAQKNHTTFTCNGNVVCMQGGEYVRGHVISRGRSVYNATLTDVANTFVYVSINADRTISEFTVNGTTQADMLSQGAYNVFCAYYKLVENGSAVDNSATVNNEGDNVSTTSFPYLAMGVLSDNTLIFMATDGRTYTDAGLTSVQAAQIMIDKGCVDAWALDGGGSTSLNYRGEKLNRNIDGNGTDDRLIRITLNIGRDNADNAITEAISQIGEAKQRTIRQIIPYINDLYAKFGLSNTGRTIIPNNTNLNNITEVNVYAVTSNANAATMTNCPTNVAFIMVVEYLASSILFYTIRDYNGDMYTRRNYIYSNADHFTAWEKLINAGDIDSALLTPPTTDGTYTLKVTVSDGQATYSWESE